MKTVTDKQRKFLRSRGKSEEYISKLSRKEASERIQAILDDEYEKTAEYEGTLIPFDESFYW